MASLGNKVGFLQGLFEGMKPDMEDPNNKLIGGIIDLLAELSSRTDEMDGMLDELNDYVESIDDDLTELEGMHDDDEDDDELDFLPSLDDGEDFDDESFGAEDQLHLLSNEDADLNEEDTLEGGVCPECGGMSFIGAEGDLSGLYICPHCKKKVHLQPLSDKNTPIATPVKEDK